MTVKKITIALISNSSDELKRFSVPKYLLILATIFFIICGMYLGWLITDYQILKSKMPLLDKLQKENAQQRIEFTQLAQRIKEMTPNTSTMPVDDRKSNGLQRLKQVEIDQIPENHHRNHKKPTLKPASYHIGGGESSEDAEAPVRDITSVQASARGDATLKTANSLPIKAYVGLPDKAYVGLPKEVSIKSPVKAYVGLPDEVSIKSPIKVYVGLPDKVPNELPVGLPAGSATSAIENGSAQEKMGLYPYSLQIGSYRTLQKADKAVLGYRRKGLSPYWVKVDLGRNGVWYRVFVGHFRDKTEAKDFRQENGVSGALIKKIAYANIIGIYSVEEQYEAEIKNLEKNGYFPYVIKDEEGMLRLYVGAFFTRDGVEKQHHDLTGHGIQSKIVKR